MKRLMAILLLVLALGIISGCGGPKTERAARRQERRALALRRDREALPEDVESILLYGEPMHLGRWEGH